MTIDDCANGFLDWVSRFYTDADCPSGELLF
jgi:hypothetical protein